MSPLEAIEKEIQAKNASQDQDDWRWKHGYISGLHKAHSLLSLLRPAPASLGVTAPEMRREIARQLYEWEWPGKWDTTHEFEPNKQMMRARADRILALTAPSSPQQTWFGELREHPARIWSYGGFVHEADPRGENQAITEACEYVRADLAVPPPVSPDLTEAEMQEALRIYWLGPNVFSDNLRAAINSVLRSRTSQSPSAPATERTAP
jgi:hypothetical protein